MVFHCCSPSLKPVLGSVVLFVLGPWFMSYCWGPKLGSWCWSSKWLWSYWVVILLKSSKPRVVEVWCKVWLLCSPLELVTGPGSVSKVLLISKVLLLWRSLKLELVLSNEGCSWWSGNESSSCPPAAPPLPPIVLLMLSAWSVFEILGWSSTSVDWWNTVFLILLCTGSCFRSPRQDHKDTDGLGFFNDVHKWSINCLHLMSCVVVFNNLPTQQLQDHKDSYAARVIYTQT